MCSETSKTLPVTGLPLPPPAGWRKIPLFAALMQRKTTREISGLPLSDKLLANLLWAAFGVNREHGPFGSPGRTAASASNSQEIDVFVALKDGAYRYDAVSNALIPIANADLRALALTPGQSDVQASAPVELIYVVDVDRLAQTPGYAEPDLQDPEIQKSYYYVDTGLIAANVYLFAADQGLAAWFHNCDRKALAQQLGLHSGQRVLFAQSVGYPVPMQS